ncbi:MAG TPA: protein-export chaperone SecB [Alphaproteobacteria bacterium]|nr:protein-export chaperone SecB [Alphaproteobacteria bacterium]
MVDSPNNDGSGQAGNAGAAPEGTDAQNGPQIGLIAQYVKDLSFENPNSPQTLQSEERPEIDVTINVNARRVGEEGYEVELKISVNAKQGDKNAFIAELVYAGLFGIRNLPDDNIEPFLLIECPRLIFPFARRIIADTTRDGGFPPLMLDPVDFGYLYQQQRDQAAQQNPQGQPVNVN